jgi:uncharacterized protein YndB with AHSA1/START domain
MASTAISKREAVGKAEMLIRKPVSEVFAAFTEPEMITKFWLARASGRLEPGARVHWDFIVHGAASDVEVKELKPDERILIRWDDGDTVDFRFTRRGPQETFVTIENRGFTGDAAEVLEKAVDSTGGFTLVLCELKALLEHGIRMNYGPDKFPDARLNVERQPAG